MRREGDGSQLSSLPRDIRSQRDTRSQGASRVSFSREPPPGHSGISENAASGEEPGSPVRSLTLSPAAGFPAALLPGNAVRARRKAPAEKRRGEERR